MEKVSPQVTENQQPQDERAISSRSGTEKSEVEKPTQDPSAGIEDTKGPIAKVHLKTYLTVFAVCLIYVAQLINVVGAGARAQDISIVLGNSEDSVWLTSSVTIFTVVLSPPVSQAADYWGRRWFLIILTFMGIVGSIIVARANSMNMAIAGMCINGLSYGAQPLLHAVVSEVLPRKDRPFAQATVNVAASLGGLLALVIGGAMARHDNHEGFRNYWYMSTAFYALATALCLVLYNPPPRPTQLGLTTGEKLKKLDWIGYFLLASGLVLFCIALSWSQNPYQWTDVHILATFLIGVALIAGLAVYETWFKTDGMFHHGLFSRGWNFVIALICVFVEGLVFFAANNYFAFEATVLYDHDPLIAGTRYGINFIVYAIAAIVGGAICAATKKIKIPTAVAFVSMIIFFICMATATTGSSKAVWGYPVFLGIGLGVALCALLSVAQFSTPSELIAITSGLMISVRSLGGSIGLAIYNAIFTAKFTANLGTKIAEAVLPLGLPQSSLPSLIGALASNNQSALLLVPDITPQIIGAGAGGLFEAYSIGFRFVWISAGCFTVIAAALAVFLVDPVKEFNRHIDAPAEKDEELFSGK
ncbi:major facilitator superfamily domain-containing protein [Bisporella sp. PMI_857]|nr:major facilitator superfamily domain-containing protein [Bisporella sp. PMI_857]